MGFDLPGISLITGETVTVRTPVYSLDEHNEQVTRWVDTEVENVVVAPGSTADVEDSTRPYGTRAAFTLGFPKTFVASLRGCRCVVRGSEYAVIGDPHPNAEANCPTAWWYTAEVEAVDG